MHLFTSCLSLSNSDMLNETPSEYFTALKEPLPCVFVSNIRSYRKSMKCSACGLFSNGMRECTGALDVSASIYAVILISYKNVMLHGTATKHALLDTGSVVTLGLVEQWCP
jgi:hypothetical protein